MGARLESTFYSLSGVPYSIVVYDKEYSGTVIPVLTQRDSIQLSYDGENQERFNPILASRCSLTIEIENLQQEAFIDDLINSNETRFTMGIYQNGDIKWGGFILTDLAEVENQYYPFSFKVSATDGIGRLKDLPYQGANEVPYTGKATLQDHFNNILANIGLLDFVGSTIITLFNWSEVNQADGNPLENIRFDHLAFTTQDENGNYQYTNTYIVLREICKAFGARFFYWGGSYYLVQVNFYDTVAAFDLNVNLQLAGGIWRYLPPLRQVKVLFKYIETLYAEQITLTSDNSTNTIVVDGDFKNGERLVLKGLLEYKSRFSTDFVINNGVKVHRVKFGILFAPAHYLERKALTSNFYNIQYGESEWVEDDFNNLHYYEVWGELIDEFNYNFNHSVAININTPRYTGEDVTSCRVAVKVIEVWRPDGGFYTEPDLAVTWQFHNISIKAENQEETETKNYETIYTANNTTEGNSKSLTIPTKLGDNAAENSPNRLQVFDGTEWIDATNWMAPEGTTGPIGQILADEILAGQTRNTRILSHTLIDADLSPLKKVQYKNVFYLFAGGTFLLERDQVAGEWYELNLNRGDKEEGEIQIGDGTANPKPNGLEEVPPPVLLEVDKPQLETNTTQITNNNLHNILTHISIFTTEADIEKDTPYTEIITTPLPHQIGVGNPFQMVHPVTGMVEELIIKPKPDLSPYEAGDTTIYVEWTPTTNFPYGSYAITNEAKPSGRQVQRFESQSTDVIEVNFDLPDTLIDASLVVLRAGREVFEGWDFSIENNTAGQRRVIRWNMRLFGEHIVVKLF